MPRKLKGFKKATENEGSAKLHSSNIRHIPPVFVKFLQEILFAAIASQVLSSKHTVEEISRKLIQ